MTINIVKGTNGKVASYMTRNQPKITYAAYTSRGWINDVVATCEAKNQSEAIRLFSFRYNNGTLCTDKNTADLWYNQGSRFIVWEEK